MAAQTMEFEIFLPTANADNKIDSSSAVHKCEADALALDLESGECIRRKDYALRREFSVCAASRQSTRARLSC